MPGMGPPPKAADQRARRNASVAMTRLPAAGRTGRAPAWPLGSDHQVEQDLFWAKRKLAEIEDDAEWCTSARDRAAHRRRVEAAKKKVFDLDAFAKFCTRTERDMWSTLWKTPQATQWEKLGWTREVALYVRHQAKAEGGSLDDAKEARQMSDRLGLSPLALLRLRWEIVDDAAAARPPARRSRRNSKAYGGLKVVG